jgi:hypothetical protein
MKESKITELETVIYLSIGFAPEFMGFSFTERVFRIFFLFTDDDDARAKNRAPNITDAATAAAAAAATTAAAVQSVVRRMWQTHSGQIPVTRPGPVVARGLFEMRLL